LEVRGENGGKRLEHVDQLGGDDSAVLTSKLRGDLCRDFRGEILSHLFRETL